jgi:hypothetical protein
MRKGIFLLFLILFLLFNFLFFNFKARAQSNKTIILNEIMWGKDADGEEWIELKNLTNNQIDLTGWSIDNAKSSNGTLEIEIGTIPANGYFLICDNGSKKDYCDFYGSISLNDIYKENGPLILKDKNNNPVDQTPPAQSSKWPAGDKDKKLSMQRVFKDSVPLDSWTNGDPPTPHGSGILLSADAGLPIVSIVGKEITFDGSKSTGNIKEYIWNFGDGQTGKGKVLTHSYNFPGNYIVSLTVSDGRKQNTASVNVIIYSNAIFISEFSPKEKWVEIVNESNYTQDISGWGISDSKDKASFKFPENSFIAPKNFLLLSSDLVGSILSEKGGSLFLFYPSGDIRQQIDYEKTADISIARSNGEYFYTKTATPGAKNIITNESNNSTENLSNPVSTFNPPTKNSLEAEKSKIAKNNDADLEKKTSESSPLSNIFSKNLLADIKNNKLPILFSVLAIILFSGICGFGLVKLRRKLKNPKQKIEVEIEE